MHIGRISMPAPSASSAPATRRAAPASCPTATARQEADRLIVSAVELARTARDEYLSENPDIQHEPVVAASVGPYGAAMHDGSEYTGDYDVSDDDLRRFHSSRLRLLDSPAARTYLPWRRFLISARQGFFAIFSRRYQLLPGYLLPVGTNETSVTARGSCAVVSQFSNHPRVLAVGINCTPPQFIPPLIGDVKSAAPDKAIVVYPNSGETYHVEDNSWSGQACDLDNEFNVNAWHAAGAILIGGCCRTGPEDIARIRSRLAG